MNETIPAWLGGSGVNVLLLLIGSFSGQVVRMAVACNEG